MKSVRNEISIALAGPCGAYASKVVPGQHGETLGGDTHPLI